MNLSGVQDVVERGGERGYSARERCDQALRGGEHPAQGRRCVQQVWRTTLTHVAMFVDLSHI